ncbi:MAG TPA: hypothetical protein VNI77_09855, partial [Nitrososphaera sp.]|nr:hypothetical protein [Nitrososphaera sp.]
MLSKSREDGISDIALKERGLSLTEGTGTKENPHLLKGGMNSIPVDESPLTKVPQMLNKIIVIVICTENNN